MRLDLYLASKAKGFSRSVLQKFIREKGVVVDGKRIQKTHFELKEGVAVTLSLDDVRAFVETVEKKRISALKGHPKIEVLHSCEYFLAYDKPPGCTTESLTEGFFPVHRLDKDTSGILIVARTREGQLSLQKQWQKRAVKKQYITLVKGELLPKKGAIDAPISRSMKDRKKMAISGRLRARPSYTEYAVQSTFVLPGTREVVTLVDAFPRTGRTHQIRVHFESIGHPVVGDTLYGDTAINKNAREQIGLQRQFLHATSLEFVDSLGTGESLLLTSPLPKDLAEALKGLIIRR